MNRNNPPGLTDQRSASGPGTRPVTVAIATQGCKLNQADSQVMAQEFARAGFQMVDIASGPQVLVVNTCTVTGAADAKARQALRSARRSNPETLVVATGCYAERVPESLERLTAVSLVVGNSKKHQLVSMISSALEGREAPKPVGFQATETAESPGFGPSAATPLWLSPTGRTRAMIKIQEGCDQVCAYCIVPKVRGRERSIPAAELISRINECQDRGFQEVVLTGTQLGTYGFDLPGGSLRSLLAAILAETSVPRIRVSSLQAQELDAELLDLWQDSRLCPHFHIPLQSGSDDVLRAMRRRYDTARFAEAVGLVRGSVPDTGITTDIIVGFPGETDEMFRAGLDFASSMGFSGIHAFPFSPRPGTSAYHHKAQTPEPVKKDRMSQMLWLADETSNSFRRQKLGRTYPVLWESSVPGDPASGPRVWSGLTHNYLRVHGHSAKDLGNAITPARLVAGDGSRLDAQVMDDRFREISGGSSPG